MIATSQIWVVWLLYAIGSFFLLYKAWKQHSGGAKKRSDATNWQWVDGQDIPFYKTTYFIFWLILTGGIIFMSFVILGDYL